jgi:hypothetical protein
MQLGLRCRACGAVVVIDAWRRLRGTALLTALDEAERVHMARCPAMTLAVTTDPY